VLILTRLPLRISLASGVHLLEPRTMGDKTVHGSYFTTFTRGIVDLDVAQLRAVVADDFKDAISAALSAGTREEVQSALRGVFNRTGHVFRTRFWLGASAGCHSTGQYEARSALPYGVYSGRLASHQELTEADTRDHLLSVLEYEASQWANGLRFSHSHTNIVGDSNQFQVFNYKTIVGRKFRLGNVVVDPFSGRHAPSHSGYRPSIVAEIYGTLSRMGYHQSGEGCANYRAAGPCIVSTSYQCVCSSRRTVSESLLARRYL
jgi:hypothetical protein